jgi:hypothetical protein
MCKGCIREFSKHQRAKNKIAAIRHYSGGKMACACCGETTLEFLGIDHINGGGTKHRKKLGNPGGFVFYIWLRLKGYPLGYRVLCQNCNLVYGTYGYCPHQSGSKLAEVDCDRTFGSKPIGSAVAASKLTESDIPTIRELIMQHTPLRDIARRYGVSDISIRNIRDGKTWKQVA